MPLLSIASNKYAIKNIKLYILEIGDAMRIIYLVKEIRKRQGLTLRQLEKKTGIANGYLSEIENNEKNPSFIHMLLIAKALNVQLEELYKEIR